MPINLPPGVSLHPNSSTRNRVQPTGDFVPFSVRAAVGQTNDLFVAYASDGTTKLTRLTSDGTISSPGAGSGSEHFGVSSAAAAPNATALGSNASVGGGDGGVAVGRSATCADNASVAVGYNAMAQAAASVAVGQSATAANTVSVALGAGALAGNSAAIAIGQGATASGAAAIALGQAAFCNHDRSIAVGTSANVQHDQSIALGYTATTTATNQFVVGNGAAPITDAYFGNGVVSSSPAALTLHATGGSGPNIAGASLTFAGGQGTGSAVGGDLIFQSSLADGAGSSLNALHELMRLSNVGVLSFSQLTSIQDRTAFDVTPSWATATDASRKARTVFNVYDTVAREVFRIESNGSAAMLGFLGAAAVVQQAATADLKDAWCGFGFQVNGGATPLNLDGGSMTAGNYATAIATKIANYTVTAADGTILADATTAGFSVTLPTAVGITGRVYVVKKIDTGSNLVTVVPNGAETIDGSASAAIRISETALALQSDGAGWRII